MIAEIQSAFSLYQRVDFSLQYQWISEYLIAKAGFSAFNLFNRKNVIDRTYHIWYPNEVESEPQMTYIDRLGLRITPSVFLTLQF